VRPNGTTRSGVIREHSGRRRSARLTSSAIGGIIVAVGRPFSCLGFVCALVLGAGASATGQPVPVVPGLLPGGPTSSRLRLIQPGAPVPTLAKCAAAWNRDAPRVTLRWVAARRPARAVIQLPPVIPGQGLCLVSILLRGNLTLLAQGLWEAGAVHAWHGSAIVTVPRPSTPSNGTPLPKLTGTIDPNGQIRLS
jgi:hypothetical protein